MTIGSIPDQLGVTLVAGADFVETLETLTPDQALPQPWPTGTTLLLAFGDAPTVVEWLAVIDAHLVSWTVQSEAVDTIIMAGLKVARLWYVNGPTRLLLAVGEVEVYG